VTRRARWDGRGGWGIRCLVGTRRSRSDDDDDDPGSWMMMDGLDRVEIVSGLMMDGMDRHDHDNF
jgi:hypothetical protein